MAAEKADAVSRQVVRIAALVRGLLDVTRVTAERVPLERETFDMSALLDEVLARAQTEIQRSGCEVSTRIERPCVGRWDRMRLDQVVSNLLSNALKYGAGGHVDIELESRAAGVRLLVRDNGIGIAPEDQTRIFDRFERAAAVSHYGGFGLGLWIARQIVESAGGTIRVDSAPGVGSTFVVDLPRE